MEEKKGGSLPTGQHDTILCFLSFLPCLLFHRLSTLFHPQGLLLSSLPPPSSPDSLSVTADLRDTVFLKLSPVWKQRGDVLDPVGLVRSHSFMHAWSGLNMTQRNTEPLFWAEFNIKPSGICVSSGVWSFFGGQIWCYCYMMWACWDQIWVTATIKATWGHVLCLKGS